MRAARFHGPKDLRIEEVPKPHVPDGHTLVAMERVGICGTDLEEYLIGPVIIPPHRMPMIIGHEYLGRVIEDPSGKLKPGTLVIPDGIVGCGNCYYCDRHEEGICKSYECIGLTCDGGMAELMATNPTRWIEVPSHVPADVAVFAEPMSVAVRAMNKVPAIPGTKIAVTGGGTVGLLIAQVARSFGAAQVVVYEPNPVRQAVARSLGFETLNPLNDKEWAHYNEFDALMECSGVKGTTAKSLEKIRNAGTLVLVGFRPEEESFHLLNFVLSEKRILGTAAHMWDVDVAAAVALLAGNSIDTKPLLTDVIALDEVVSKGFERLLNDKNAFKIVVDTTR